MSVARRLLFAWFIAALAAGYAQIADAKVPGRSVEPVRQIELSEEKITHYLAARPAFDEILAKAAAVPEPRYMRLLNETARKNGFADYADYESVAINVVWILTGIDPLSKKYVGVQTVTKQEAAILLSDKALSPRDHRSRFDTLHAQMLTAAPTKFAANIALVTKYYDKLFTLDASKN
ncbi:MAG: hypothetical protein WDN02_11245 [Methylovirgula sp.]|uniref:hypothetical protein n=1 Tax=Methylovirgula sp. TaxID=1978224 RepID=UPI003075FE4D